MVLYTGDNTNIFQKSFVEKLGTNDRKIKQPKMFEFLNVLIIFLGITSIVISIGFLVILVTTKNSIDIVKFIESNSIGYNWFKKLLCILTMVLNVLPWTIRAVGELTCILLMIRIKMTKLEYKPLWTEHQRDVELDKLQRSNSKASRTRNNTARRKSSNSISLSKRSSEASNDGFSPVRQRERRNTVGKGSSQNEIRDSIVPHQVDSPKKPDSTESGKSHHNKTENELQEMMGRHLNVVNYLVLPELGGIDQVCFDKTDTLTSGIMRVAELTTYMRCYKVPPTSIYSLIGECKANPDAFGYEDDQVNMMESEDYSEKSQEYLNEIEGFFNKEVLLEDESCDMIIDPQIFPDYASLTKRKEYQIDQEELRLQSHFSTGSRKSDKSISKRERENNLNQLNFPNSANYGSKDSPREGNQISNDIRYLNLLEKKFRQKMNPKSAHISSNISKTAVLTKPNSDKLNLPAFDSTSDFGDDGEIGGENRINFKIDKKLTDKNFIFDVTGKKDHLIDFFVLLLMSNEGSSVI